MISDFIYKYYVYPIEYGTGYNIYNTITYAILFVVLAYFIYKIIPKNANMKRIAVSSIPFILLGSSLRVLEDAGILHSFVFVTPVVWILVAAYAVATFFISNSFENKYAWAAFGTVPFLIAISHIKFVHLNYFLFIVISSIISSAVSFLISKNFDFMKKENMYLMFVHMFDASTTFTALSTGMYFEEHVLGGLFTRAFGPIGIYFMKIPALLFAFYILEKEKNENLKYFIKLLILILGLGPGTRNMLRLIAGV